MSILKRRRGGLQGNLLSFLDVISSGFGAIVMLLVITKTAEPIRETQARAQLQERSQQLAVQIPTIQEDIGDLQARLAQVEAEKQAMQERLLAMRPRASEKGERALDQRALTTVSERLAQAQQSLTEEMRRLQQATPQPSNAVGGIPIDSEHIVFIIDTSGSMQRIWPMVVKKLEETLRVFPQVKGIQVMNDMGDLMFEQYAGQWIPDTPVLRKQVLERLRLWQPFSNSSPVEGIEAAIRMYRGKGESFSIYMFGDEFGGGPIQPILDAIARINPKDANGKPAVRIHAIGFPSQYMSRGVSSSGIAFAMLMREISAQNGGTFIGLRQEG
ncbi:MAG: VWA domain-containing protein [Gammaproteobacteria bacterium]|jgi:hypothetical protein|nr:VWA domain-containing protein [Gammaproteobacteria bacterium]